MAEYVLGQSKEALERLAIQAEFFRPTTERMLRLAGVVPGMRVLDVGCGAGDTTFLAAELIGAEGHVLGLDLAAEPIEMARRRARAAGLDILVGAHDFLCGPHWAEIMIDGLPDPDVTTFERSGHFAHIEQPVEFANAVTAFANSIAATGD